MKVERNEAFAELAALVDRCIQEALDGPSGLMRAHASGSLNLQSPSIHFFDSNGDDIPLV